jgi:hypothetical protein
MDFKGSFWDETTEYSFSGADGRFSFGRLPEDVPQFALRATHSDYVMSTAVVSVELPKKQYQADIMIHPGLRVRGRIVDSAGSPVARAHLSHLDKGAWTDEQGRFVLPGMTTSEHDGNSTVWITVHKRGFVSGRGWCTPKESGSGQWTLKLLREKELAFSGRAVFATGAPAGGVDLEFRLKDAASKAASARGRVDDDGRFSIVLPQAGVFSGLVQAQGVNLPGYNQPRQRWLAPVAGLGPGKQDVRIVLDDRGAIRAAVRTANPLPASLKFRVLCDMADVEGQYRTVHSSELDSTGGTATIDRLSPGKYRVTVAAVPEERRIWTKDVVLDANTPGRAEDLEFIVPELKFGNVRATVLLPDGNTPAKGNVWLDSPVMGKGYTIEDGAVDLKDIPTGRIWLTTTVEGMAQQTIKGVVRDGQTTDLGRIVLQRFEDATGVVEGRVLYDDGTPAIGAVLVGNGFDKTPVGTGGRYSVRLPAGKGTVVVDMETAVGWPRTAADIGRHGTSWQKETIQAPVQVPAGGTVKLDIVLPRKKLIDLPVDFRGTEKAGLSITLVVELDRCRLVRVWSSPKADPGIIRILHLPSGPTTVSLHAAGLGYRCCQAVPQSKLKDGLVFDPSVKGTITVRTLDRSGKVAKGVRLKVLSEPMAWRDEPASMQRVLDDGTIEFTGLGPGVYIVQATGETGETSAAPVKVQVQAGKNTPVQMTVDTDEAVEAPSATQPATRATTQSAPSERSWQADGEADSLIRSVREAPADKAYELLARAFFAGQYDEVEAAFAEADKAARRELGGYRIALLRGRNAAARFIKYDYADRDNLNGWPTTEGAIELRRLAGLCTAAYGRAYRLAPSSFERGQVYCLWHDMLCSRHFDADSQLLRGGSPFAQPADEINARRLKSQTALVRQAIMNALAGNEHAAKLDDDARKAFVDVFAEEYQKLAAINVPQAAVEQILAGIPDYARMLLADYVLDKPDKSRLTVQYCLWRAIAGPKPDAIERQIIDGRVDEFAGITEKEFDSKVTSPHLPAGRPELAKWWRETYKQHKDNLFFVQFQVAPLPFRWERRDRVRFMELCRSQGRGLASDLAGYEQELQKALNKNSSESMKAALIASLVENRDNSIRFFTMVVKSLGMHEFGRYQEPAWQSIPEQCVVNSGGSGNNPYSMFQMNISKTRPMDPFPVRKALTVAESIQRSNK